MKWRNWVALGLTGAAAVVVISCSTPSSTPHQNTSYKSKSTVSGPDQEKQLKQNMLKRDVIATERLSRQDAKGHLQSLANELENMSFQEKKTFVSQMQKDHKHFQAIIWVDIPSGKEQKYRRPQFKTSEAEEKQLGTYVSFARKALAQSKSYESPSFPEKDPKYFIAAQPTTNHKHGVILVLDASILNRVKEHQNKNLRLIPYPKEGKYKVESIHTDTLRDMTVKTGHDNENASHYYENEIVVVFEQTPSAHEMKQIESEINCKPPRKIVNSYIFQSKDKSMEQMKQYFTAKWKPKHIEPHYLYMTNETDVLNDGTVEIPNDVLFTEYQWNLPIIETNRGWNLTKGNNDVIVAVVDTGVDLKHPDLQGRLLPGYNAVAPDKKPMDDVGHGTHVAGIISANVNNHEGIAGMMWGGKILPVKALDSSGSGTSYSVAEGIIWAADHGAKVINLSLGNYADANFLHEAVKYAYDRDIVIVAATGNDNTERPGYPAAYPEVLSVSATDTNLGRASFSNYGDYIDVMAPGESIASTYPDNQYAALSGTSMASPHVAALAALIRSINPTLKNTEVMDIIRNNVIDLGDKGRDKYFGYGQIDVYSALQAAGAASSPLQFWPQYYQRKINKVLEGR